MAAGETCVNLQLNGDRNKAINSTAALKDYPHRIEDWGRVDLKEVQVEWLTVLFIRE